MCIYYVHDDREKHIKFDKNKYYLMKTAIILAGGLGTRLRPLTLETPKPLILIRDKTLIEHNIEKLKEAEVKKIYLSIGYLAEKIIDYFKDKDLGVKIEFLVETQPLGTGGCMHLLTDEQRKKDFSSDFIVINGDNLFDLDWKTMKQKHTENNAVVTIALTETEDVSSAGVVKLFGDLIEQFVEKPTKEEAPSNFISSGYYIFSPKVFEFLPDEQKFMFEKELFPILAQKGLLVGYHDRGQWFDTGTFERWEGVKKKWRIRKS